jgi:MinD-like ATPase involved in chromosome partitioning or flagellar assembly
VITDPDGRYELAVPASGQPYPVDGAPREPQPVRALRPVPPPPVVEEAPALRPPVPELPPLAVETATVTRPSFGDLLGQRPDPRNAPASEGVRGAMRTLTGGRWRLAPGVKERAHRDRVARIQQPLDGAKTVAVVNPKGGAHKTTGGLLLAQKLGTIRGGGIVFVDFNEARATAAWRAMPGSHNRTMDDLVRRLLNGHPIEGIADLDEYMRSQGPANFDLLAAAEPENPLEPREIPAGDVRSVHAELARFYRVIIEDTGNNMAAPNWGQAVLQADQLVIVSTIREDTGQAAGWLADALVRAGREDLLHNAVTVLSSPAEAKGQVDRDLHRRFTDHFGQLTRAVHTAPFDPALAPGTPIHYPSLLDETHEVWEAAAADVTDGLAAA